MRVVRRRHPWGATGFVATALTFASGSARAQPAPTPPVDDEPTTAAIPAGAAGAVIVPPKPSDQPPPPTVTPPTLTHFEHAPYPKEALGLGLEGQVVLILDIDVAGHVTKAVPAEAQGHGFDEAAVGAALKFQFEPAKKAGTPVASRIRYRYSFTLEKPPTPPVAHVAHRNLGGKVLAAGTNAPLAGATITARAPDGTVVTATAGQDGSWGFVDVAPALYHLTVSLAGYATDRVDESVEPGKATEIVFRLFIEVGEEVTVKGDRQPREVTHYAISEEEINRIPGTNGDAIRSLENLPGVGRPPGLAGLLIVRGSAPQDTQIFVDGTSIPLIYHFGGLSSVVPTEMLEKIDFYPGNFSAEYGRAMGGIVDVGLRSPKADGQYHGFAQVDLIDMRLFAEGPIPLLDGWNFIVAGRRSWIDVWARPLLSDLGATVTAAPVYYDYQAMIEKKWKNQSFRVTFFGDDDRLALISQSLDASSPQLAGDISDHMGFWRIQARYENRLSDTTTLRLTPAYGTDTIDINLGTNYLTLSAQELTFRGEISEKIAKGLTANFGVDVLYEPYSLSALFPPPPPAGQPPPGPFLSQPSVATNSSQAIDRPAFYALVESAPWPGGRLVPGIRLDYSSNESQWDVAPRFSARQAVNCLSSSSSSASPEPTFSLAALSAPSSDGCLRTTLKGGVGVYYQPPQPFETDPVFGQLGLKDNRAVQYELGVEQVVTRNVEVSLDGFYKQLDQLVTPGYLNEGTGRVFGLETLIRYKPDKHFFGWIAYTLSRSTRTQPPDYIEELYQYDQTHILTVLGSYKLGHGWEFGARFRLVSGNLYTPSSYGFFDESLGAQLAAISYPPYGQRLPLFHQLDMRVDKTWKFRTWKLGAYLDAQNVYNQQNVEGISYNYNYTRTSYVTGLPFLPSFGLRAEF
jgi:TonB family protein